MTQIMRRGKQQIMHRFLPGKVFDFERVATIAKVASITGSPRTDLNVGLVLAKIGEEIKAWDPDYRPGLRDEVLSDPTRFTLLDPVEVQAELFPKVFRCSSLSCGHIISGPRILNECPKCRQQVVQLRFVKVHRCGTIQALEPPNCPRCRNAQNMALDMRGSEKISNFRWVCRARGCTTSTRLDAGFCPACQWPDPSLRRMDIEPHRAGRTYYPHSSVLLNLPNRDLEAFLNLQDWQLIVAAKFLNLPAVKGRQLSEFRPSIAPAGNMQEAVGLSMEQLAILTEKVSSGEITPQEFVEESNRMAAERRASSSSSSVPAVTQAVVDATGVEKIFWEIAGQELLETVIPSETTQPRELESEPVGVEVESARRETLRFGLRLTLLTDFPILRAAYGYSRLEYTPNLCRLNPFPPDRFREDKFPIFVDQIQADALLLRLEPSRVLRWMDANGFPATIPNGTDRELSEKAFFVKLLSSLNSRRTIEDPQARMTFGLLHTIGHIAVRRAALLCGLDSTSLSEYILPKSLSVAVYSNHRAGATIGALWALFEQTPAEWLRGIGQTRKCVYDPVCRKANGSCHACTHLAETSCRFFNLNLGRAFLFGGKDPVLGDLEFGYFDERFATTA